MSDPSSWSQIPGKQITAREGFAISIQRPLDGKKQPTSLVMKNDLILVKSFNAFIHVNLILHRNEPATIGMTLWFQP